MRIISSFHDYYDVAITGSDQSGPLYLRAEEVYDDKLPFPSQSMAICEKNSRIRIECSDSFIVGFCGKIYGGVKITFRDDEEQKARQAAHAAIKIADYVSKSYAKVHAPTASKFCYSLEEMEQFIDKHMPSSSWRIKTKYETGQARAYAYRTCPTIHRDRYAKFFEEVNQQQDSFQDMFIEHKTPIFVYERAAGQTEKRLVINATLKDFGFVSVFDPFTAFQELEMYFGGLASPEKEVIQVSNDTLIGKHGFNQSSFRRESPGKKKNRPKNQI